MIAELTVNEEALFIPAGDEELFTFLHLPRDGAVSKLLVFCHPFAEEKLWSHRLLVRFARELASRGIACARFDMRGYGDSDGEFADISLENHLEDVSTVCRFLTERFPSVAEMSLLGLRLGATVASLAANRIPQVAELILWEPVLDGARYMQEILRANLAAQMLSRGQVEVTREDLVNDMLAGKAVNVEGYPLTHAFFDSVSQADIGNIDMAGVRRGLALQVVRDMRQPMSKALKVFGEKHPQFDIATVQELQFWREIKEFYNYADNLFPQTLDWIVES